MLAKKTSLTMSPSVSSPTVPPPMISPTSAFTSAWTELPNTSQATYSRSTSMSRTSRTYSATLSGSSDQKQPKTSSMKHADYHPPSPPCRRHAKRSFNDSTVSGSGGLNNTKRGQQLTITA